MAAGAAHIAMAGGTAAAHIEVGGGEVVLVPKSYKMMF